ncbi:transforming growth factor beta receptor type 3-like isoform X2 [Pomacea canaliculata]|uniref:transforming growth factor beta receptor type 3-like isoform X2 n=1 Tax=Pomacea canaliculata TaxID=400727 RepID=UPI000D72650B|nr:transforming growth factor beta receptor type 3-like isoform X2 [Pomacea canaliculata]
MLRHSLLVLFLWILCPGNNRAEEQAQRTCEISQSNNPHYVVAYIRDYRPGRGCYSNSSSRSHQHVHVISLKLRDHGSGKSRRNVVLKIEPKNFQDLQDSISSTKDIKDLQLHERQVAFILNSQHPVNWQIETSMKFQPHTRQHFFIPRHSTVRFKKRRTRVLMRKRHKAMPSPSDEHNFLKWVRTHFGAVTSYSEVDGDRLLFFVGQEGTSSECLLNAMMPSPFAFIADMERQKNVKGCVPSGMHSVLERPVYIIELEDIPQNVVMSPDRQVELDIMPADGKKVEHDFYLVLRSPHNVKWILRSHRVQGWIDVVTDADVDLRGIRMHTVALRREEMVASGVDLIRWVDYYIAYVQAYTLVSSANVVHLLLPSDSSKTNTNHLQSGQNHGGLPTKEGNSPNRHSTDMREELKNIIKTRCDNNVMEVTLPTLLTQARELDLSVEQLSLLDGSCRATKNRTDVILRTDLDKCRTSKITVDDIDVYSNAIVIHASGVVGALLEEELGSGYFDLQATSGSGWSDANGEGSVTTYIDDEDFTAHKVEIDVQCRVPRASVTAGAEEQSTRSSGQTSGCGISVYTDPFLVQKVSSFPLTVSSFKGVYIISSAPADWQLHVLLDSCWVSRWSNPFRSDPDQIDLVHNGCLRSPNLDWFKPDKYFKQVQYSPSGLVINRILSHGSYLHCQLSTCHEETGSAEQKCPPEPADRCNSGVLPNVFPRLDTKTCGVYTVGPLEITASDIQLMPDSDQTSKPFSITSSRSSTAGRGPEGQGQSSHQSQQSVVIEGLDSGTVVGIAFAAFAIGILLTGALWFIHTHTSPTKRGMSSMGAVSGDVTPNSSSPISA